MLKNINVGTKCLELLQQKYAATKGIITAESGDIYILGDWLKCGKILVCYYIYNIK